MDAVIIDVNRFHMITERYGKEYGDTILRKIGERVRQLARKMGGVGCRRGADTFLIYAPHREDYAEILEKLTDELDSGENQSGRVRLRMGVYYNVDRELEIERRFDRAKIAADSIKGNYAVSVGEYDSELHESALFRERLLEDFKEKALPQRKKENIAIEVAKKSCIALLFGLSGLYGSFLVDIFKDKSKLRQQLFLYGILNLYENDLETFMKS